MFSLSPSNPASKLWGIATFSPAWSPRERSIAQQALPKCCPAWELGTKTTARLIKKRLPIQAADIITVPERGQPSQGREKETTFCVSHSSQAGSPSGSPAVSFDVAPDSLKLGLSHFTTCLMGKPSCTSLTLKKDMSHTIEGKGTLGPTPPTRGGA